MIKLASLEDCTGCGVCSFVCGKYAISLRENNIGVVLPEINYNKCIECGRCVSVCPSLNPPVFNSPLKAYAAWNNITSERASSASGAIASSAYDLALKNGWDIAGAIQNADFSVEVILSSKAEDIAKFKNSKYVFSSISKLLPQLKMNIKENRKTLVIALPCQIAAIRKCFVNTDLLLLADVVCHGCTPFSYLSQHIKNIETQRGKKAVAMSFRDPLLNTYTYTFSLYDNRNERFYAKRTIDGDVYQIGFHRMISYRENCFHCHYARPERVGDFTLSDYSGLGRNSPIEYNRINCSCILINTENGEKIIQSLIDKSTITAFERPLEEPIMSNRQLQRPCGKTSYRKYFEKEIQKNGGDFEKTMDSVLIFYRKHQKWNYLFKYPKGTFKKMKSIIKVIKRKIV